jgi:hypothetical protein
LRLNLKLCTKMMHFCTKVKSYAPNRGVMHETAKEQKNELKILLTDDVDSKPV